MRGVLRRIQREAIDSEDIGWLQRNRPGRDDWVHHLHTAAITPKIYTALRDQLKEVPAVYDLIQYCTRDAGMGVF